MFKSAEEMQARIDEYFACGAKVRTIGTDSDGDQIYEKIYTITGLCLFCGFEDRHSMLDYEKRPEFSRTMKKARTRIECEYETNLSGKNPTGSIFALKNFGWRDKTEVEISNPGAERIALLAQARERVAKAKKERGL